LSQPNDHNQIILVIIRIVWNKAYIVCSQKIERINYLNDKTNKHNHI